MTNLGDLTSHRQKTTLTVGLTGGLGSGKSTVSDRFQMLGVPIIDADELAHFLVKPGTPALKEIITQFGDRLLNPEGTLDRHHLRQIVFGDPSQRKLLEKILHPAIYQEMAQQRAAITAPYLIFSIPLLIETSHCNWVDQVLVVDTPVTLQYQRVSRRDGLSQQEIQAILKSQCSRKERLAAADQVLYNEESLDELYQAVDALHQKYLTLSNLLSTSTKK